jgi:2-octaprenyl-6-methoxyphenol hydroxylase
MDEETFDVAIAGGGMVGASLAVALLPLGLRLALIEPVPLPTHSRADERTTALSNGSWHFTAGALGRDCAEAAPIRRIQSRSGRFGFARIDAREQGVAALGFVVANRVLGAALWGRLAGGSGLEIFCPAHVDEVTRRERDVELRVTKGDGTTLELRARLLVAADGAQSSIRSSLGIDATVWDYEQTAIVTNVATRGFTITSLMSVSRRPAAGRPATRRRALHHRVDAGAGGGQIHARTLRRGIPRGTAAAIRFRFGRDTRGVATLIRLRDARGARRRLVVIIGNAAGPASRCRTGFNLGLRDAATLAEVIAESSAAIGDQEMLARYDEWRRTDRRSVIAFTDGLIRLFNNPLGSVKVVRDLGLLLFDVLPPAKSALAALSLVTYGSRVSRAVYRSHERRGDVVIVGGGMVGPGVPAGEPRLVADRIVLIEAHLPPQPATDGEIELRVSALSRASERLLRACGAWPLLSTERLCAFERMCVWDEAARADGPGSIHFDCATLGEANLGYIVENRQVQWALLQRARALGVRVVQGQVSGLNRGPGDMTIELANGSQIASALVVAADGADSPARRLMGIETRARSHEQQAVVTHVETSEPHQHTAWQRFLKTGPIALCRRTTGARRSSGTTPTAAAELLAMPATEFVSRLSHRRGAGLSFFDAERSAAQQRCQIFAVSRFALAGDAARRASACWLAST